MADNFHSNNQQLIQAAVKRRQSPLSAARLQSLHQGARRLSSGLLRGEEDNLRAREDIGQDWLPQ